MSTLLSILTVLGPMLTQISGIVAEALAANATRDQATLDALHAQALAMANALAPAAQGSTASPGTVA